MEGGRISPEEMIDYVLLVREGFGENIADEFLRIIITPYCDNESDIRQALTDVRRHGRNVIGYWYGKR